MMIVGSSIDSSRGPRPISQLASRLSRFSSLWRIRHSSAITVRIPPCWMRTYSHLHDAVSGAAELFSYALSRL
jgi:hypothetical protein